MADGDDRDAEAAQVGGLGVGELHGDDEDGVDAAAQGSWPKKRCRAATSPMLYSSRSRPCSRSTDSAPATIWPKNQRAAYGTITPTVWVRPLARREAIGDTTYDSDAAACSTRSRVSSETLGSPRRVRDTVAVETPASRATSSMLTGTGTSATRGG
ncbi:hypothetical protein GCM10027610_104180 [Dactylosporangium cerinum]